MNITVSDITTSGDILNKISLDIQNEKTTLREIISSRIHSEVIEYNKNLSEFFNGLVQPKDSEKTLNGYKLKKKRVLDPEKQAYIALESFSKNGFFVLVDNKQVSDLNEELIVTDLTPVQFVKLTPLVGG